MAIETDRSKIVRRLEKEGWVGHPGGKHDKFKHPGKPGRTLIVPRHRVVSPGVARNIAAEAGWI